MADITMCSGIGCDKKENCYRYTAPKNEHWQSMFMKPPVNTKTQQCESYWEAANETK